MYASYKQILKAEKWHNYMYMLDGHLPILKINSLSLSLSLLDVVRELNNARHANSAVGYNVPAAVDLS